MNIANQGFPATRADLNNALQALASNNSGTSAPSTTFANQWWYDTQNNKLYIRNEANNAWIQVAVLDQTNNEWQITTGVVQAKDGDGLALKTDDGTTRFFIKDSDGSTTFTIGQQGSAFVPNTSSTWNALEIFQDRGVTNSASGIAFRSQSGTAPSGIVSVAGNTSGGVESLAFMTSTGNATSEAMRITNAGDVGIGTSSPSAILDVRRGDASGKIAEFHTSTGFGIELGSSQSEAYVQSGSSQALLFNTNGSNEQMRIASNGNVYIGTIAEPSASQTGVRISGTNGSNFWKSSNSGTSGYDQLVFINGNGTVGSITTSGSGTTFAGSSDYRLKENVTDISDGITRIKQLSPRRFNFIADADTTVDGFIAHEAQTVVPEAVTGTKDAMMDEEYTVTEAKGDVYTPATEDADEVVHSSNVEEPDTLEEGQKWRETAEAVMGTRTVPKMQGIDQAKIVPLLTAALKEAISKIETLETKVAALEG